MNTLTKPIRYFFYLTILVLIIITPALSQEEEKSSKSSKNDSLETAKKLLANIVIKNGSYQSLKASDPAFPSSNNPENRLNQQIYRIINFKFDGCKLDYTVKREAKSESTKAPSPFPTTEREQTSPADERRTHLSASTYTKISFDLADIDSKAITYREFSDNKKIIELRLKTLENQNSISYQTSRRRSNPSNDSTEQRSTASLRIKSDAVQQTAKAFIEVIRLCQAIK